MLIAAVEWLNVAFSLAAKAAILHQIVTNHKRRSVAGLSVPFFVVGMISYDFYTLTGLLKRDWLLVMGMSPGVVLALVVVAQMRRYRGR